MSVGLNVHPRQGLTRSHLRQLRNNGYIPGILYGKGISGIPVEVEKGELIRVIRSDGRHALVQLSINEGKLLDAMIHDIQVDPLDRQIIHVDFHQIRMDDEINTVVPIHFVGTAKGIADGGVMQQQLDQLDIRCLPKDIPSDIEVNIEHAGIGESIRVSDIIQPPGVEIRNHPEDIILSIKAPRLNPVAETEEDPPMEPEIVDAKDGPGIDAAK